MYLFFDTETTGKHLRFDAPVSQVENFARLVQLGYIITDDKNIMVEQEFIIKPEGFEIPIEASNVHHITTEIALEKGQNIKDVLDDFAFWVGVCDTIIGHNIEFDLGTIGAEYWRLYQKDLFAGKKTVCTMKSSTEFCKIPNPFRTRRNVGAFKYPKLAELFKALFGVEMGAAHTALQDIQNTVKCYFALVEKGVIK